jgi:Na+/melibiose symporter-like transporter
MNHHTAAAYSPTRHLPRTVIVIGFVSLLNDFASEMVTPLIPLLLATMLGAGPMALGIIEGFADTTTNLLKLWAGRRSDMTRQRRKPFLLFGYALSNMVRPLIGFSERDCAARLAMPCSPTSFRMALRRALMD